jgi:hypothetical protein
MSSNWESASARPSESLELTDNALSGPAEGEFEVADVAPATSHPLDELEELGPVLEPPVDKQLARMPSRPPAEEVERRSGSRPAAEEVERRSGSRPAAEEVAEKHPSLVPAEGDVTDPAARGLTEVQNYRKLYETELRPLPLDQRIDMARRSSGAHVMALCFDQDVEVIKAILVNDRLNLDHARIIAANHLNAVGLELLTRRTSILSILNDARVQRSLLRNVQLSEGLMKRILNPKRLLEVYRASIDREVTDRTRTVAKSLFKSKFATATPEERFEVIWSTEGRVLPSLLGQTLDQKTTALFCARPFTSVMLIQAFCRFPATPPGILGHILKQPLVMRQSHLRNMAMAHPNVPSDAKRKM